MTSVWKGRNVSSEQISVSRGKVVIWPDKEKLEVGWHPTHLSQAEHSWSEELLTSVQAEHSQPLELARAHILKIIDIKYEDV